MTKNSTLHLTNGIQRPLFLKGNLHCGLIVTLESYALLRASCHIFITGPFSQHNVKTTFKVTPFKMLDKAFLQNIMICFITDFHTKKQRQIVICLIACIYKLTYNTVVFFNMSVSKDGTWLANLVQCFGPFS